MVSGYVLKEVKSLNRDNRIKVRIKFSKHGPVKFVGHLDFMRFFQKAIRRAKIDIAYSEGFSPHQIMSFATALGVGVETDGDYLDIEVMSTPDCVRMKDELNAVVVDGVKIENVTVLPDGAPNAMSSVAAAGYKLYRRDGLDFNDEVIEAADRVLNLDTLIIRKENKKAKKKGRAIEGVNDVITMDIKAHVYEAELTGKAFTCLVDASSAGNVRPMTILELIYAEAGLELDPLDIQIVRCDLYREENGRLVTLDHV